jgi:hypothetical protein
MIAVVASSCLCCVVMLFVRAGAADERQQAIPSPSEEKCFCDHQNMA